MAITTNVTKTVFSQSLNITRQAAHSGGVQVLLDEDIAASTTDAEFLFAIDISKLEVFAMMSTVDMTIETNSPSAAQETFALLAGQPVIFEVGQTAIFAGDVTAVYVTSATAGNFKANALQLT